MDLTPSDRRSKAITYAQKREPSLHVYPGKPVVAIDTEHLEGTLRIIPMRKKDWMCLLDSKLVYI